ncbi:MAG: xanthine dehydrogenase family protein subunit M [Bryobacteraceae bacterium]|nr:xanthine dehydrogenase family protein subunit M [Bryobacteraceae bacterium]MDW8377597.1 xanthine dehydrogenase family protein subunit M [Bryobacterales bacterium]
MKWFDYAAPDSLEQAAELLARYPEARPLAGGTDLLPQLRAGKRTTPLVVDVKKIPELSSLTIDEKGALTLGAAVPCYRIYEDERVCARFPALAELASILGGIPIQGRASLGGNLCNASPSADAIPLLMAMHATAETWSTSGARSIPVEDFCIAPGRSALAPGELLVSIRIPALPPRTAAHYLRFIPRNEMDIAVVGVGVSLTLSDSVIQTARIALGAVAPTPILATEAAASLENQAPTAAAFERAARLAQQVTRPISDMRGTAEYRRHLAYVLTRRALEHALQAAAAS